MIFFSFFLVYVVYFFSDRTRTRYNLKFVINSNCFYIYGEKSLFILHRPTRKNKPEHKSPNNKLKEQVRYVYDYTVAWCSKVCLLWKKNQPKNTKKSTGVMKIRRYKKVARVFFCFFICFNGLAKSWRGYREHICDAQRWEYTDNMRRKTSTKKYHT